MNGVCVRDLSMKTTVAIVSMMVMMVATAMIHNGNGKVEKNAREDDEVSRSFPLIQIKFFIHRNKKYQ